MSRPRDLDRAWRDLAELVEERRDEERRLRATTRPPSRGETLRGRAFQYFALRLGDSVTLLPSDWAYLCADCGPWSHGVILVAGREMTEEERGECLVAIGWRPAGTSAFGCGLRGRPDA